MFIISVISSITESIYSFLKCIKKANPSANLLIYRGVLAMLVLEAGLEPAQPQWPRDFKSLVSTDSTIRASFQRRAENETRTRDPNLGKVMLYQLSYFRVFSTGAKISSLLLTAKLFRRKVLSQPAKRINYLASKRFSASSIS